MPFITEEDNLGKALILNATEKMSDFLTMCARWTTVTWEELDNVITVGVWNPEQQMQLFNEVHAAKQNGKAMPCLIPGLLTRLRVAVSHSFHIADKIGGVSGVGSMVFSDQARIRSWHIYNPRIITANFREGNFGRISGLPRRGKTNLGCVMMEQFHTDGFVCFSNIMPDPDAPPQDAYTYVKDAMALFLAVASLEDGVKWVFIHDEGGLMYGKADAATRRAKDLDKFARVIGKLHGNYIIVEQRPESVPTIIQDFSTSLFFCESPGIVQIELKGPMLAFRDRVKDFPKTKLPMQTYDIAYFNINVNIVGLLNALSGERDVKQAMRDFLDLSQQVETHIPASKMKEYRLPEKIPESEQETRNCVRCGEEFVTTPSSIRIYCTAKCRNLASRERMARKAETSPIVEEP